MLYKSMMQLFIGALCQTSQLFQYIKIHQDAFNSETINSSTLHIQYQLFVTLNIISTINMSLTRHPILQLLIIKSYQIILDTTSFCTCITYVQYILYKYYICRTYSIQVLHMYNIINTSITYVEHVYYTHFCYT